MRKAELLATILLGGWVLLNPPGEEADEGFVYHTDRPYSEWGRDSEHPSESACLEAKQKERTANLAFVDSDTQVTGVAKEIWRREVLRLNDLMRCVPSEQAPKKKPSAAKAK